MYEFFKEAIEWIEEIKKQASQNSEDKLPEDILENPDNYEIQRPLNETKQAEEPKIVVKKARPGKAGPMARPPVASNVRARMDSDGMTVEVWNPYMPSVKPLKIEMKR